MRDSSELYLAVRKGFPDFAQAADRRFFYCWGEQPSESSPHIWFECLAEALNEEMRREARIAECSELFAFVARALGKAGSDTRKCIDASFVENLFRHVPPAKVKAYWSKFPPQRRGLYTAFHGSPPR